MTVVPKKRGELNHGLWVSPQQTLATLAALTEIASTLVAIVGAQAAECDAIERVTHSHLAHDACGTLTEGSSQGPPSKGGRHLTRMPRTTRLFAIWSALLQCLLLAGCSSTWTRLRRRMAGCSTSSSGSSDPCCLNHCCYPMGTPWAPPILLRMAIAAKTTTMMTPRTAAPIAHHKAH
jgi:hypothetical protein